METLTISIRNFQLHYLIKILSLICMPGFIFIYFIFFPITLPVSILICHYYKFQIKQQLNKQYQYVRNIILRVLDYMLLSAFQYIFDDLLFGLVFAFMEQVMSLVPIIKLKRLILTQIYFLSNLKLIKIFIRILVPPYNYFIKIIRNNALYKVGCYIYINYLIPLIIRMNINRFILNSKEKIFQYYCKKCQIIRYSIQNDSNKMKQRLKSDQEPDKFKIQLHQNSITSFWSFKSFKDKVILELECEDAAGLSYIAETYSPKKCIGVVSTESQIQKIQSVYNQQINLIFARKSLNQIDPICQGNNFDIIIGFELKTKLALNNINFKSYLERITTSVLSEEGYLIISNLDTQQNTKQLENNLNINGLKLIDKYDFTCELAQTIKFQITYVRQHTENYGEWISKCVAKKLKPDEKKLQQLRDKQLLYKIYILKKINA